MKELDKRFDFKSVEDKWIAYWKDNDTFHATPDPKKKPYVITIPPPNVTGILHMGHALNNTLQDIIIRYKRMNGFATCWMPGTDHAGIATQNVLEKALAKEGKKRQDLGREKFIERLWDWKKEYGDTIIHQLEKIGASCDWPRTRFTMDEKYSNAVKQVFIKLYEKDLIYKGEYIINWCPRCHTALSDEEAEHQDTAGHLYHFNYPLKDDPNTFVTIATTRPETMLGDTAVAVNPNDKRYKDLIGKTLILPLVDREIPIIADEFVDPEFGTGCVKVTPAHDPNDFAMGKRHDLPFINVMNEDASMNAKAGSDFEGLDRFEAREIIIESLKKLKLLGKIEEHQHAVGHCYRCHTVVEPYLSHQWFVKMEPLAKPALEVVKNKKVRIHPDRWEKVYINWLENIRDWCISRQIWWGHRIPVWYDEEGNIFVAENDAEAQEKAKKHHGKEVKLKQDEDVLDTWFSSWLWPFATFNWPEENEDVKFFYPGSALFTASEIIFFWVARMVMAGIEFMGDIPFEDVYIHGTVRDAKGLKMSKSLGNSIDPLEIVNEYGADALRFSLIINSGQDLYIAKEKFEIGRNFANKIWNASRLVFMNVGDINIDAKLSDIKNINDLDLPSQWIIAEFYKTLEGVGQAIEKFKYSEAESLIYEFFWNHYCDWYLEIIKNRWSDKDVQMTAYCVLKEALKMMSPFIPFVTEELWQHCQSKGGAIASEPWPKASSDLTNSDAIATMQQVIDIVTVIRTVRAQWKINKSESVNVHLVSSKATIDDDQQQIIKSLGKVENLTIEKSLSVENNIATGVVGAIKVVIPLGNLIDVDKEKTRMIQEIEQQRKLAGNLSSRLGNENFVNKAPADVVEKEKERLKSMETKIQQLEEVINHLQ